MSATFVLRLPAADGDCSENPHMVFLPPPGLPECEIRSHAAEAIKIAHSAPSFANWDPGKTEKLIVTALQKHGYTWIEEVIGPDWDRD
ncbi:hypothetical protein [Bosea sp. ANAM02]|uniref:hypothetical protein n=1 Tax=Bosea sp. ANAM02 TaxID=2020412 RepID=UPI00140EBDC1|nr:hypothetical protein [Bosea sp. ANAM02]BCB21875.1 hypothetical protein OCUBac02_47690 [Bosea sp. ANAM02]